MKIFGDNVLSLYICTQTIKGFYVYLLSSFYIGVQSFGKSTGPFSVHIPQGGMMVFIFLRYLVKYIDEFWPVVGRDGATVYFVTH